MTGAGGAGGSHGPGRASARPGAAGDPGARDAGRLPQRVHPALLRDVLYGGVERPVIALEGTLAAGLLFTVGPQLVTLAVVVAIVSVLHPAMAWVTSRDPLATAIYVRSLRWRDFYAPHGTLRTRGRAGPTLPRF